MKKVNQQKIGFFGGGFDPIHFGHLNLAIQMQEKHQLDEIVLCPAHCSPLKKNDPPKASAEDRLDMCKLAIEDIAGFSLSKREIERGSSYTIDSIRQLQEEAKRAQIFLILSDDALPSLMHWKEIYDLLAIARPLIGRRVREKKEILQEMPKKLASLVEPGLTSTPLIEISSTEIRERIKKGAYCGHLIPQKILDYIHEHQVYGAV